MILFWTAVIALTVWVVKLTNERSTSKTDTALSIKPLDIIRERYAKGEISREEFENLKKELTQP
jgi:putative membrane protein